MNATSPALEGIRADPVLPQLPRIWLGCALLIPQVIAGVYQGAGEDRPDGIALLGTVLVLVAIVAWFRSYCRALRVSLPMDIGWFLIIAWPIVVPYFLISREGWRGLRRIGFFLLAVLGAAIARVAAMAFTAFLVGGK